MTDDDRPSEREVQWAMKMVDLAGLDPAPGTNLRECAEVLLRSPELAEAMREAERRGAVEALREFASESAKYTRLLPAKIQRLPLGDPEAQRLLGVSDGRKGMEDALNNRADRLDRDGGGR